MNRLSAEEMASVRVTAEEMDLLRYAKPGEAWRTQFADDPEAERRKLYDTLRGRRAKAGEAR